MQPGNNQQQLTNPKNTQPVSNRLGLDLANLNLNDVLGANMNDKIRTLKELLIARGIAAPLPTPSPATANGEDDGVRKYTRQQFEDLYKMNINRESGAGSNGSGSGGGYFDQLFFMFQLYVAFINAIMNAANMSASLIFNSQPLQNVFSMFLVNALNIILKTNVGDLTPEQLRDLLEKNRPVLQQIAAIIIDEASQLLVGLSDVCKKLAMDWIENVLPGLVKSAAIGIPSAVEAAIPPLGEVVEILNTGMAILGSFMKVVGAFQRNFDNVSEGYGHVKGAFESLQKIKDLLSQPPSEIIKSATAAALTPVVTSMAQTAQTAVNKVLTPNPFLKPSAPPLEEEDWRLGSAPPLEDLQDSQPSESSIRNLADKIKEKFNDIKKLLKDTFGINISGLSDLAEKIKTNSILAVYLAKRFGMTVTNLQANIVTRLADELKSGDPDKVSEKILRPVAAGLNKVSNMFDESSREIYKNPELFKQGGGGSGSGKRQATTRRKYLKDPKKFNRYISKLRKKTAKKELELLKSIQEIKSM